MEGNEPGLPNIDHGVILFIVKAFIAVVQVIRGQADTQHLEATHQAIFSSVEHVAGVSQYAERLLDHEPLDELLIVQGVIHVEVHEVRQLLK